VIDSTEDWCHVQLKIQNRNLHLLFTYLSLTSDINKIEDIFNRVVCYDEIIIMGDFNCRLGQLNPPHSRFSRSSKDVVINQRGKFLINILRQSNLFILNGCTKSDRLGEFTFSNKNGNSCVDICLVSDKLNDLFDMSVLEMEGSCHFPILLKMNPCSTNKPLVHRKKVCWDVNKKDNFAETLENILTGHGSHTISIDCFSRYVAEILTTCDLIKTETINNSQIHGPVCFDDKCIKHKKTVRKCLRLLRRTSTDSSAFDFNKIKYLEAKKTY
jgi:hypothetical protein